jgi:hypothetical protein
MAAPDVEPTVAEIEEAITHVRETAGRYSRYDPKYVRLHAEIDALLGDREQAKLRETGTCAT